MRSLDLVVICAYLVAIPVTGILLGGRQRTSEDYFLGSRQLPWWAVCFSVVATETSTLTVISVPTLAYLGMFTYLQLTMGYLVGRIAVAYILLPKYYEGKFVSAYAYLGQRFGSRLQATASATFLVTRLLADGLRLFAAAIPVKVMLWAVRINASYWQIVLVLALLTVIYTLTGGIRAVVWIDAIQLCIYLGGALLTALILSDRLPTGWFATAWHDGKLQLFDFTSPILTQQYSFVAALVGGAVFAMASHGADQLMVQRLLSCRSLRDSQLAVIASGVVVLLQSGLFLLIGTMLWSSMSGASPASLGLTSNDELFPQFIVTHLPPGLTGLLLAGILSAAMSTLSGSLNSLSSSTVSDLARRLMPGKVDDSRLLRYGKLWILLWAVAFVLFASLFSSTKSPVVELGLSIASYTYGALLGAFLLGLLVKRAQQSDAIVAFVSTLAGVLYLAVWVAIPDGNGGSSRLAFPWYAPIGVAISLAVGGMLSLRHARPALEVSTTASAETP